MSRGKRRFPVTSGMAGSRGAMYPLNRMNFLILLWSATTATRHPFAVSRDLSPSRKIEFGPTCRPRNSIWACSMTCAHAVPKKCEARQEDQVVQRALSCLSALCITLHYRYHEARRRPRMGPKRARRRPPALFVSFRQPWRPAPR